MALPEIEILEPDYQESKIIRLHPEHNLTLPGPIDAAEVSGSLLVASGQTLHEIMQTMHNTVDFREEAAEMMKSTDAIQKEIAAIEGAVKDKYKSSTEYKNLLRTLEIRGKLDNTLENFLGSMDGKHDDMSGTIMCHAKNVYKLDRASAIAHDVLTSITYVALNEGTVLEIKNGKVDGSFRLPSAPNIMLAHDGFVYADSKNRVKKATGGFKDTNFTVHKAGRLQNHLGLYDRSMSSTSGRIHQIIPVKGIVYARVGNSFAAFNNGRLDSEASTAVDSGYALQQTFKDSGFDGNLVYVIDDDFLRTFPGNFSSNESIGEIENIRHSYDRDPQMFLGGHVPLVYHNGQVSALVEKGVEAIPTSLNASPGNVVTPLGADRSSFYVAYSADPDQGETMIFEFRPELMKGKVYNP